MSVTRSDFLSCLAALGALGVAVPAVAKSVRRKATQLEGATPVRALVLSGGGARGAYEAGVLRWLYKDADAAGPPFDLVCGTSAGAINAAFSSRGTRAGIAQAESSWRAMPSANVLDYDPAVQHGINAAQELIGSTQHGFPRKLSFLSRANREFRAMGPRDELDKMMGIVREEAIQNLVSKYPMSIDDVKVNLVVTATNITVLGADAFYAFHGPNSADSQRRFLSRNQVYAREIAEDASANPPPSSHRYRLTKDNFIQAITASAAVPGVFKPVGVAHAETGAVNDYVDGGVANNIPIGLAVDAGATEVTMVMVEAGEEEIPKQPDTMLHLLRACLNLVQRQLLEADIRLAFTRNLLSQHLGVKGLSPSASDFMQQLHVEEWRPIKLRVIRPAEQLTVTTMGFDDARGIADAIDIGYQDAQTPVVFSA